MSNFLQLIHDNNLVFYTCGYQINMYTKEEIKALIADGTLYKEDYKKITGEDYDEEGTQA